jgi:hypothetical protein
VPKPQTGSSAPTALWVPDHSGTSGPEVAELVRSTGVMEPMPWQELAWDCSLGERISSDDGRRRWAAFQVGLMLVRQAGKGGVLEGRALGGLHLFGERRVVWSATRLKPVSDALERMELYYASSDELGKQVKRILKSHVDMVIELYGTGPNRLTGTRQIAFMTRTKHTARGLAGDCVFLDEAYGLDRQMVGALVPILDSKPDPQLWLASTPPLDDILTEYRLDPETANGLPLYDLRRAALRDHDQDVAWMEWSPPFTLDQVHAEEEQRRKASRPGIRADVDLILACNPSAGRLQRVQTLLRSGKGMSPVQYAREKLGAWRELPEDLAERLPLPEEQMLACLHDRDTVDPPDLVVIAAEASPHRASAAIVSYGLVGDGSEAGVVEVIDHRPGASWVPSRLAELLEHRPLVVVVSSRGPLAPEIDNIAVALERRRAELKMMRPVGADPGDVVRGDLVVTTLAQDAVATAQLIDAVRRTAVATGVQVPEVDAESLSGDELWHLGDPLLLQQADVARLRDVGDGAQTWGRRSSRGDITTVFGASLARWGWSAHRALLTAVPMTPEQMVDNIR